MSTAPFFSTHSAPPRLVTASRAPAYLSIKSQWDLLKSHLEATSYSPDAPIPSWLNSMEKPVLSILLTKLRSELDLLHSEASRPSFPQRKDSAIQMPDDQTRSPCRSTTSQAMTYPAPVPDRAIESLPAFQWELDEDESGHSTPNYGEGGFRLPEPLSPLSPTFGPRKGSVPIGTVARRRSGSVAFNCSLSEDSGPVTGDMNLTKRMLWLAAWLEIERH
jgi:hypothetical protein